MEVQNFSSLESAFLQNLPSTYENLVKTLDLSENSINLVIESLLARNTIFYDKITAEYNYASPIEGEKIILEGNVMLPVTIIKMEDKILVSRGKWYEFPLTFDTRRIVWNVELTTENGKSNTLINLLKESVLKERKSKITQLPEYQTLVGKIVPWNEHIGLKLNSIGAELTDVNIIFKSKLYPSKIDKSIFIEHKGLTVRSEIKTEDLINQLKMSTDQRNFQDISLNRIFSPQDFIFSNNEIVYSKDSESIYYVKITGIRNKIELTYYTLNVNGTIEKNGVDTYENLKEGYDKILELYQETKNIVESNDFLIED